MKRKKKKMNDVNMDKPTETENLIDNQNKDINIPLKFKLYQKVYHPRITDRGTLLDIREYYIVRIAIVITGYSTSIDYHASPYKGKARGQLFRNGDQLFSTYNEALKYAKEQECNIENI